VNIFTTLELYAGGPGSGRHPGVPGVKFKVSKSADGFMVDLMHKGQSKGFMGIKVASNGKSAMAYSSIITDDKLLGKGLGRGMYVHAIEHLQNRYPGVRHLLSHDSGVNKNSKHVWNSLSRDYKVSAIPGVSGVKKLRYKLDLQSAAIEAGGIGSGCTGNACGRPSGSGKANEHKSGDRVYSLHKSSEGQHRILKTSGPWHLVKSATGDQTIFHDKELAKTPSAQSSKELIGRLHTVVTDAVTRFSSQSLRDESKPVPYSAAGYAQMQKNKEYNSDLVFNRSVFIDRLSEAAKTLSHSNPEALQLVGRAMRLFSRQDEREASQDSFQRGNTAQIFKEQTAGMKVLQSALEKLQHSSIQGFATGDAVGFMDSFPSFHPPSLKNPQRVPSDQPGETNDRFLDVTKRNSRETESRRDRLIRNSKGQPVPVRTTLIEPGTYVPPAFTT
jgi:hypothetical protein